MNAALYPGQKGIFSGACGRFFCFWFYNLDSVFQNIWYHVDMRKLTLTGNLRNGNFELQKFLVKEVVYFEYVIPYFDIKFTREK